MGKSFITALDASRAFDSLLRGKSAHTKRAYRVDIATFASWRKADSDFEALADFLALGSKKARELAFRWQKKMSLAGDARNSVTRRISTLKAFVGRAELEELVDWRLRLDPFNELTAEQKKAADRRKMEGPTPKELKRVKDVMALDRTARGLRDAAIFALGESPMLRRSEISGLNVGDVDLARGFVTIVGKARKEPETLAIPQSTKHHLEDWLNVRGGRRSDPVFVPIVRSGKLALGRLSEESIYQITLARGSNAGIRGKKIRPHGLRHAGITNVAEVVAERGLPVTEGMALSRHKKLATFQKYLDRVGSRGREILEAATKRLR